MKIQFLGGAGTVTGSKTLIESNGIRILVDCGLFQGERALRDLNWNPISVLPSTIDYVLLTHGHLDHCGWLPRLVHQGFEGQIFCTNPTKDVSRLILLDSAKIQEEEAEKANEEHYSKHNPAEPLYTVEQAEKVFPLFRTVYIDEPFTLEEDIFVEYSYAGHIIGACSIAITIEGKKLVFSGDIGRDNDVLMFPPVKPKQADYVFLESTYGNKLHPDNDPKAELEACINDTFNKNGNVVIPSFAVERAQTIMFLIWQLKKEGKIPDMPYIIDTPMGLKVLDIFTENTAWHKMKLEESAEMCSMFTMITEYEDTIEAIYDNRPKVVIAASGMITGGRVLSYLERYIELPETTVIIVGYQAEGTRGRKLLEGEKEIKIHGKYYPVAARIIEIEGLSAHGDQEDLINWVSELKDKPRKVFLMHGEADGFTVLKEKIEAKLHLECVIPELEQIIEL
ncbi:MULTISPECIES: MBL fold metallo-hydrolase [Flavobacterium]|uniref:MBL fold metallo-hydrolase n=1 Tax=Flavobacterium TaxID=237 RepID=UPI00086C58B7|nr:MULTISPECIES: MBL fold metallo-hydrolase [Flavobacterium]MBN9284047.1 MBL fold metallo-hydrolase [Flavobacterium sp.]ODS85569.1 MAG: MBL fold metallo-hydrolase [Chryseobacterium sp. SCN 40-13]OJV73308.1 MAG: MBL fold metallo-hydrolase [Flavobacterium sp. 40-81]